MPIRDPKKGKSSTSGPLTASSLSAVKSALQHPAPGATIQWDGSQFNTGWSAAPTVHQSPETPTYPRESDVWIDTNSGVVSVYKNGAWEIAGRGEPYFHQQTRCELTGTHHMKADSSVRYLDGTIVGYCADCDTRMEMPFMSGGYEAVRLRDLAAGVLVARDDASQFNAFEEELQKLVEHVHELNKAINEAQCVEQVVFDNWVSADK